jgi:hypothetical protein
MWHSAGQPCFAHSLFALFVCSGETCIAWVGNCTARVFKFSATETGFTEVGVTADHVASNAGEVHRVSKVLGKEVCFDGDHRFWFKHVWPPPLSLCVYDPLSSSLTPGSRHTATLTCASWLSAGGL